MEVIRWSNVTIAAVVEPVGRKANADDADDESMLLTKSRDRIRITPSSQQWSTAAADSSIGN